MAISPSCPASASWRWPGAVVSLVISSMRPGTSGQTLRGVGRQLRVARLAESAHVADHRDRPHAVVVALEAPGRDRRRRGPRRSGRGTVFTSHSSRSTFGPVPPIWRFGASSSPATLARTFQCPGGVSDFGPSAQNSAMHPAEVGLVHDVGRVRLARRRVQRMTGTVVRAERVVASGARRDVDGRRVRRVKQAAVPDDLDDLLLERRIGRWIAELGLGSRVDRDAVGAAVRQGEPRDVTPVDPDGLLHPVGHRDPVLGDHVFDLEWLPAVRVDHRRAQAWRRPAADSRACSPAGRSRWPGSSRPSGRPRGPPWRSGCRGPPASPPRSWSRRSGSTASP